jgi:predicted nucleic acid-binding protein
MFKKFFTFLAGLVLMVSLSSCATDTNYEFGVGVSVHESEVAAETFVELTTATVVFNSLGQIVQSEFNVYSVPLFINGGEVVIGEAGADVFNFAKLVGPHVGPALSDYIEGYTVEQIVEDLTDEGLLGDIEVSVLYYIEALVSAWEHRTAEIDYSVFGRQRVGTILTLGTHATLSSTEDGLNLLLAGTVVNINDKIVAAHVSTVDLPVVTLDGEIIVGLPLTNVSELNDELVRTAVGLVVTEGLVLEGNESVLIALNHAIAGLNTAQVFNVPAVIVPEVPVEETPEEETTEPETEEPVDEEETTEPVEETPEEETEEPVTEEPSDEEDPVEETPVDEEETTEEEPANP